ncbi:sugar phosphate isomerase/epimerase family protein [Crateriforma spongiae]|uniref:sugar phosphate isomerase/epimerase family protein n=1 Tax=Crateriforma spongiae TaxID=2724528 RepID=UPI0014458AE7|nr:sugar phosphate isomerase/epimerase family protein [Crateriforma spongiae]
MAELKLAVRLDAIPIDTRRPGGLKKALIAAAALRVDAVELCARQTVRPSELSDTGVRQLRKMLDDLNLRVAAIRFQTRRGYDNPSDLERRVDATKQALSFAYRLGAPVVVNQIGRVQPMPQTDGDEETPQPLSPEMQQLQLVLDDLGRYGARVGAVLAAETGSESGPDLESMLRLSDQAFIAAALNPGQLIINRFDVDEAIAALGNRIHLVCAVDGVLDFAAGRGLMVPLGQGTADFPNLLGRLEDLPYRGPFVVGRGDMPDESAMAEIADGISYLRSL